MVGAGAAALRLRAAGHGGGVERHPRASRGAAAGRRPAGRHRARRSGPGAGSQVAAAAAPGPPAKGPLPSFGGSTEHRRPSQRLKRQRRRPHALPGPPRPSPAAPEGQRSAGRPPPPAGPGLGGWLQNRRQPRRLRRSPPSEGPIHPQRSNVKTNEAECDPRPAAAGGATPRSCGHSETGPGGARCETSGGPRREPGGRERGRLRRLLRAAAGRTEPASASASAKSRLRSRPSGSFRGLAGFYSAPRAARERREGKGRERARARPPRPGAAPHEATRAGPRHWTGAGLGGAAPGHGAGERLGAALPRPTCAAVHP